MKTILFRSLASFIAISFFATGLELARDLTFEERVAAQEAIERVYYSHQIGSTKPFEQAVPKEVLEARVRKYLQQSVALEVYWKTRVTDEMLQRELERMVRGTRLPGRLQELFAALDGDAFLIKECLARAILVNRLSRNFYAFDPALHAEERRSAEKLQQQLVTGEIDPGRDHINRTVVDLVERGQEAGEAKGQEPEKDLLNGYRAARRSLSPEEFRRERARLPEGPGRVAPVREERDAFVIRVVLGDGRREVRVASYAVPKRNWDLWWMELDEKLRGERIVAVASDASVLPKMPDRPGGALGAESFTEQADANALLQTGPACAGGDRWDNGILDAVPEPRRNYTAVWTGTVMVVWGGFFNDDALHFLNTGGRYDPATDTWTATSTVGAPSGRAWHTAVWTGSVMLVWGGGYAAGGTTRTLDTGGRYDPATDTWTATSTVGDPPARYQHTAVWTGSVMLVWGGIFFDGTSGAWLNSGGRYDPATDTWTATPTTGAPSGRAYHAAVWTGSVMVIWGGYLYDGSDHYFGDGARYDPVADTWSAISMLGAPSRRFRHTAVWTGSVMVIWGGIDYVPSYGYVYLNTGGRYDPLTDTWTATATSGAPARRSDHTALWTGSAMVVWGGANGDGYLNTGGRYAPLTDTWAATATDGAPAQRYGHTAVWTGTVMVIWGGLGISHGPYDNYFNTGGRYDPATNTWTTTSTYGAPSARMKHTAVWTGSVMVIWGGIGDDAFLNTGGRYDPATDTWAETSIVSAPSPRYRHTVVWTGSEMVVWGGSGNNAGFEPGGRYDPATDTWRAMSTLGSPAGRIEHTALWTGSVMVIWGGSNGEGSLNTGGRYDPLTDTWAATTTDGAPSQRSGHTAVWTGSVMVVWGGSVFDPNHGYVFLNTGGRYDPLADSWTATATDGAPSQRSGHTALWAGNVMVVWGGYEIDYNSYDFVDLDTGGRYDPLTDTWTEIMMDGAPSRRFGHTAVWTGSAMVVWGGASGHPYPDNLESGGRYYPATDRWAAMSTTDAPSGGTGRTAVWTGRMMLIWGNTGGRYIPNATGPPPTANAGADQNLECAGAEGTPATLNGTGAGCEGSDGLSFTWTGPFPEGGGAVEGATPTVTLPLGTNSLTLTVTDGQGQTGTDTMTVTIRDTTPPQISAAMNPSTLWPPNHRMVDVVGSVGATDACSTPTVILASVTSSEPDDAPGAGDGNTRDDIQGAQIGTANFGFQLRAERDGEAENRAYRITYVAVDGYGNQVSASSIVLVPHDQGAGAEPLLVSLDDDAAGTLLRWDAVPGASTYKTIRGRTGYVHETSDFIDLGTVACIQPASAATNTRGNEDVEVPALGEAFFYLVAYNDGRDSSYGTASATKPRMSTAGGCE